MKGLYPLAKNLKNLSQCPKKNPFLTAASNNLNFQKPVESPGISAEKVTEFSSSQSTNQPINRRKVGVECTLLWFFAGRKPSVICFARNYHDFCLEKITKKLLEFFAEYLN
jgi:hypothetical protein